MAGPCETALAVSAWVLDVALLVTRWRGLKGLKKRLEESIEGRSGVVMGGMSLMWQVTAVGGSGTRQSKPVAGREGGYLDMGG